MTSTYLERNEVLARSLLGQRLRGVVRLLNIEPEGELRFDYGPLVLQLDQGSLLLECDEAAANLVLFAQAPKLSNPEQQGYQVHRIEDFPPLLSFQESPISGVQVLFRLNFQANDFRFLGLYLSNTAGQSLAVGCYLSDLQLPDLWLLSPEELDSNILRRPLAKA